MFLCDRMVGLDVQVHKEEQEQQQQQQQPPLRELWIRGQLVKETDIFTYLGSQVGSGKSLGIAEDVAKRVQKAAAVFGDLRKVLNSKKLGRRTRGKILRVLVISVLLYGAECWALHREDRRRLERFLHGCVRSVAGIPWQRRRAEGITIKMLLEMLGLPSAMTLVFRAQTRWLGHVARMPLERLPRQALFGLVQERVGIKVRAKGTSFRMLTAQSRQLVRSLPGVDELYWARKAQDRQGWRDLVKGLTEEAVLEARAETWGVRPAAATTRNQSLQCSICGFQAVSEGGLAAHVTLSHPVSAQVFRCAECGKECQTKQALGRHRAKEHSTGAPRPRPHACRYCPKTYLTLSAKNDHERRLCPRRPGANPFEGARKVRRGGKTLFGCRLCEEAFETRKGLGYHMKATHLIHRDTAAVRRQAHVAQRANAKAQPKPRAKQQPKPKPKPKPKGRSKVKPKPKPKGLINR